MDCNACSICHAPIDCEALDEAYPHLTEGSDHFPPEGMSPLEEAIYWGALCLECARSAETNLLQMQDYIDPPEKPKTGKLLFFNRPPVHKRSQPRRYLSDSNNKDNSS